MYWSAVLLCMLNKGADPVLEFRSLGNNPGKRQGIRGGSRAISFMRRWVINITEIILCYLKSKVN